MTTPTRAATLVAALCAMLPMPSQAADAVGERITVTGELIDTWCFFSGVMGGPEAVVGSAHHTCAMWCAAGGIPVGMLADDGTVYMILKWKGDASIADGTAMLSLQSHRISAEGLHYQRDGIDYLMVSDVVADEGITLVNHDDWGVVPPFAIPDPNKQ
ncbi:MAG: hypothetical protein AAGC57_12195 [Pseudomonadota bacterium]